MSTSIVSVIVPVYNLEAYISECLDSVLGQDYAGVEVVVVNDGSRDGSAEVVRRYASRYKNLVYLETENQGLSSARNTGLGTASGDYVLFVDGDDYLERDAISKCVEAATRNHADVVLFSSAPFLDGTREQLNSPGARRDERMVGEVMPAEAFLLRSLRLGNYMPSVCLYMFDRRLVEGIRFLPGILHEDNLFTARLLLENASARVIGIRDALFNRRVRENSITTMKTTRAHAESFFEVAEHLSQMGDTVAVQGRKALFWLVQFSIKEALVAAQKIESAVSLADRARALRALSGIPVRYWKARFLPFIVAPDLLFVRSMMSAWKAMRGAR